MPHTTTTESAATIQADKTLASAPTEQTNQRSAAAKAAAAALKMERIRKLAEMRAMFFNYAKLEHIQMALESLLEMGNLTPQRGTPARCLLLTGEPGVGKSTLLHKFFVQNQPREEGNRTIVPVLIVGLHRACTPKLLAEQMLRALKVPEGLCSKGTEATLTQRVKHHLIEQRVQVVVLDEFQHLLDRRTKDGIYRVADYIKTLLNLGVASIVLSGMPESEAIYTENLQLMRRSLGHFQLKPLDRKDPQDRADFKAIMGALQNMLPVPCTVDLTHPKLRNRFLTFAEGTIGRTVDFVHALGTRAISRNLEHIDYALIRQTAFEMRDATKGAAWTNPFDIDDGIEFLKKEFGHLAQKVSSHQAEEATE